MIKAKKGWSKTTNQNLGFDPYNKFTAYKDNISRWQIADSLLVESRDVEAEVEVEAGSGSSGSGPFSVKAEAEARKIHRFRFHIGGKKGGRKKLVLLSFVEEQIAGA